MANEIDNQISDQPEDLSNEIVKDTAPIADTYEQEQDSLDEDFIEENLLPAVEDAMEYFQDYRDKYQDLEHLYFGHVAEDSQVWELDTQYSSGEAFQIVETMFPRMAGRKIRALVSPGEESDGEGAKLAEDTLNYFIETDHLDNVLKDYIHQAIKTIGALKIDSEVTDFEYVRKKKRYEMKLPMVNKTIGVGQTIEVKEVKQRFKHILETIPYENLIVSKSKNLDTEEGAFVGFEYDMTLNQMKEDEEFSKGAIGRIENFMVEKYTKQNEHAQAGDSDQDLAPEEIIARVYQDHTNVKELYCRYSNKIYKVIVHSESNEVLVNKLLENWHNQFPIRVFSLIGVENQAIGLSPLQVVEDDINELDVWLNIMISTGMFDIMRPAVYDPRKAGIDWQKNPPIYKPGMMYPMKDSATSFNLLPAPKVDRSHLEIFGILKQKIQNKLGVTNYITGSGKIGEDKTLGEVRLKTTQSLRRLESPIQRVQDELSRIFAIMNANQQQYLPDNYPIRLFNERGYKWQKASVQSIQGNFDHRVRGFEDIESEQAERINKYRSAIKDGMEINKGMGAPLVRVEPLVHMLYRDGYDIAEIDKVIAPLQETVQSQDQDMQKGAQKQLQELKNPTRMVVRPDDNHKAHLDVLERFIQSPQFEKLPPQIKRAIVQHVDAHRKFLGAGQQQQQQGEPQPTIQQTVPPSDRQPNYQQ